MDDICRLENCEECLEIRGCCLLGDMQKRVKEELKCVLDKCVSDGECNECLFKK